VVTRTDVEYLADLTLDIRDMTQAMAKDGGSKEALEIYVDGLNSEQTVGRKFKLMQLSTDLNSMEITKATPSYLFHLFGLSDRSIDLNRLAERGLYADNYVRNAIISNDALAPKAALILNMWMYAAHLLYDGVMTCQKKLEADNPSQFDLKGGGLDEFIALWIGTGQNPGSLGGYGLYALAEEADQLFDAGADEDLDFGDGTFVESFVNYHIKLLYQEGATLLSLDGVCTKENPESAKRLWSVVSRILSQMKIPLLQMLINSVLEEDKEATMLYANAVVPQASQCRASTYKRLKTYLMTDNPRFDKIEVILRDLYNIFSCFGLTCYDVGDIFNPGQYKIEIPDCIAAENNAPMALYQPSSGVLPIARVDLDILHIRILTSLGSFDFAKLWYLYGRNSPVQRDSDSDQFNFYNLKDFAMATSRKIAGPMYSQFIQYHNDPEYAHTLVINTFEGKGKWDNTKSVAQRSAMITETCAFQILYMHLIAQINDAVNICKGADSEGEYDLTHPWDEVAALLIGSLEGIEEGGSIDPEDGQLIWGLSTRRGFQFKTLNSKGYSKLNSEFEDLLFAGRGEIDALDCDAFERTADEIKLMSLVPLMQSVMKYAIQNEKLSANSDLEDLALGEAFAMAIIPIIQAVDPASAIILEENMILYDNVEPVRDGSRAVADAIGSSAESKGILCSLLGATAEAKPCSPSSASGLRMVLFPSIAAAVSFFFIFT